jgi:hypothetical protein
MKAGHEMRQALQVIGAPIAAVFGGCSAAYSIDIRFPGATRNVEGQGHHLERASDVAEILERHLRGQAESKLPSSDQMRALIAKNRPAQSWYDEDFSDF